MAFSLNSGQTCVIFFFCLHMFHLRGVGKLFFYGSVLPPAACVTTLNEALVYKSKFNRESTPKRLGNWEVPRWAPTKARPLEYRPEPKPISDFNGRFLPGAPRGSSKCFGHFTGTWDLPRKITRKVAEELAKEPPNGRFADWIHPRIQRPQVANVGRMRGKKGKTKKEGKIHEEDDQTSTEFKPLQCPFHRHRHKKHN